LVTGFLAERWRTPRQAALEQSFNQQKFSNHPAQLEVDDQTALCREKQMIQARH
jgi:hypothetical protein